jgi:hypothetical protein
MIWSANQRCSIAIFYIQHVASQNKMTHRFIASYFDAGYLPEHSLGAHYVTINSTIYVDDKQMERYSITIFLLQYLKMSLL